MAVIDVSGRTVTVAIRLRPGSIRALVPASAAEFTDQAVPLDDAFESSLPRNLELAADTPPARLVSELLRIVRQAARVPSPAAIAGTLERVSSVRGIVEMVALPERTMRDHVVREIGLSPKRALRIMRLHRGLMAARQRNRSWAAIAQVAGYADQAHLTRECRALLDETPSQWAARGAADSFKTAQVGL